MTLCGSCQKEIVPIRTQRGVAWMHMNPVSWECYTQENPEPSLPEQLLLEAQNKPDTQ